MNSPVNPQTLMPRPSIFRFCHLRRFAAVAALAACLLPMTTVQAGSKSDPDAKAKSKAEKSKAEKAKDDKKEKKDSSPKTFDLPIPVGHGAEGIKLPDYNDKGQLQMFFEIGNAFRVDEDHLKMGDLKIETYDDAGKPDMFIEMPASMLDLKTRILSSVDPVTIHRSDFEVTGGNMTFNTQTRQGKFSGSVRMLIFNRDDLEKSDKGAPGE